MKVQMKQHFFSSSFTLLATFFFILNKGNSIFELSNGFTASIHQNKANYDEVTTCSIK